MHAVFIVRFTTVSIPNILSAYYSSNKMGELLFWIQNRVPTRLYEAWTPETQANKKMTNYSSYSSFFPRVCAKREA